MDKRAIILFARKYKLLFGFLSAIIIQLPQYIDSIWSLSERISSGETMSIYWLYWITIPLGLGMLALVIWLTRKTVLSGDEKSKVIELMATVNALDDRMNRYFNKLITQKRNRVSKYQGMLESTEFKELWDKCSEQRANINTISPELGEQVRLLLMLLQTSYSYLLKDWLVSELPKFEKTIEEHITTTEAIRRRIKKTIEKLIG